MVARYACANIGAWFVKLIANEHAYNVIKTNFNIFE